MKQGGDRKSASGFTIVETLIVLIVTGALFTSAAVLVSGRQNKTQFMTAINSVQQQVQQIINETTSGFYGSGISCTATAGGTVTITSGSATNGQCIFLGKVLQLGTDVSSSQLVTYPLVGSSQTSGSLNTTIAAAKPVAVSPNSTYGVSADASVTNLMQNGLTVKWAHINGTVTNTGAVAFVAGDATGQYASVGSTGLNSGSQQLSLYTVLATSPNGSVSSMTTKIDSNAANLSVINSAQICIASGSTVQSGLITVTGNGSLAVTLQIFGDLVC